jgi:hypothetical protein
MSGRCGLGRRATTAAGISVGVIAGAGSAVGGQRHGVCVNCDPELCFALRDLAFLVS